MKIMGFPRFSLWFVMIVMITKAKVRTHTMKRGFFLTAIWFLVASLPFHSLEINQLNDHQIIVISWKIINNKRHSLKTEIRLRHPFNRTNSFAAHIRKELFSTLKRPSRASKLVRTVVVANSIRWALNRN